MNWLLDINEKIYYTNRHRKWEIADVVCLQQGGEAYDRNTIIIFNNIHIILFINWNNYHSSFFNHTTCSITL